MTEEKIANKCAQYNANKHVTVIHHHGEHNTIAEDVVESKYGDVFEGYEEFIHA